MFMNLNTEINLGTSLIEKKLITSEQLRDAFDHQKIKGGYLSQRLIELGYIKDTDITTHLTCEFGYSYIPMKSYAAAEDALACIPAEFACDFCILPIEKHDKLLTIAMADPLNKGVIELIRQISRCEIVVLISTRTEIRQSVERYYGSCFKDFELDKYRDDVLLRDNLMDKEISNGLYTGINRRRYKRLSLQLAGEYYVYPNFVKTGIKNLSMGGMLFETPSVLSAGSELAVNIHLDNYRYVTAVVEIIRSGPSHVIDTPWDTDNRIGYETGAFFSFMPEKNQEMLAQFLRRNFKS
ncbi:MAG: PilZ domain-containing protein [Candidatus Omnitrophica bacterium]|nr:PilZ domain-containing protein [Candidatus Omnitrophota bacterium]MDD5574123.1 PilZ domain-containing protein [Candidatus Omnitrophota bacterium]